MFIVLEGLDGCGKTTQGNILKEKLEAMGYTVHLGREPGGTEVSERLREIILDKTITDMDPVTEMYLYAAARCQLVRQVVRPALERGEVVILDRYVLSSIAYQGYGRNLGEQAVRDINAFATGGLEPDLTILFNMHRREDRLTGDKDRMELSSDAFFERVYEGYMTAYNKERTLVIDAAKSIGEIAGEIFARVSELIK